jgi:hypothetical protein
LEELVAGLLRPRLFPFGKLSKAKSAAHLCTFKAKRFERTHETAPVSYDRTSNAIIQRYLSNFADFGNLWHVWPGCNDLLYSTLR